MKKIKLAFIATAAVAVLSAFSINYFSTFHYTLRNGLFELVNEYEPGTCNPKMGAQCTYLLETTGIPPSVVTSQDALYNNILNNPDPYGVNFEYEPW